jgi:DhnA family fructose-bisphosphate aldolase class Ia
MKTKFVMPAGTVTRTVKVGTTLNVIMGNEEECDAKIAEFIKKARKTGEEVVLQDRRVWFSKNPIVDLKKKGSAQYRWDRSGNRVKCEVVKHTVMANGDIYHRAVGTCFADLD